MRFLQMSVIVNYGQDINNTILPHTHWEVLTLGMSQ